MLYLKLLLIFSSSVCYFVEFFWVTDWLFCWQWWHCPSFHAKSQFGCQRCRVGSFWGVRCQLYDSRSGGRHQNRGSARTRGIAWSRCVKDIIFWTTVVIIVSVIVALQLGLSPSCLLVCPALLGQSPAAFLNVAFANCLFCLDLLDSHQYSAFLWCT